MDNIYGVSTKNNVAEDYIAVAFDLSDAEGIASMEHRIEAFPPESPTGRENCTPGDSLHPFWWSHGAFEMSIFETIQEHIDLASIAGRYMDLAPYVDTLKSRYLPRDLQTTNPYFYFNPGGNSHLHTEGPNLGAESFSISLWWAQPMNSPSRLGRSPPFGLKRLGNTLNNQA